LDTWKEIETSLFTYDGNHLPLHYFLQTLGYRLFTIWGGQAFSLVGSAIVQFALVWWLTAKIGSATILTTVAALPEVPAIVNIEQNRLPSAEKADA